MSIPTASVRPTFPYISTNIPSGIKFAAFVEAQICDWNLKMEAAGTCKSSEIAPIFTYADWKATTFEETKEVIEDGLGGQTTMLKRIDPIYRFETYATETMLEGLYQVSASSVYWTLTDNDTIPNTIEVYDLSVSHSEISKAVYRVTVEFRTEKAEESFFGITGCCKGLYVEAPYEDPCDPSIINTEEVKKHEILVTSGNTVAIPDTVEQVLAVFKDQVRLVNAATYLGYTASGNTVTLSEAINTNNPQGGEVVLILYKILN